MNTKITYLYKDKKNYKKLNEAIVKGKITESQKERIYDSLEEGELFIPSLIDLPEERFGELTEDDCIWFELVGFSSTNEPSTSDMTIGELAHKFEQEQYMWESDYNKRQP